MPDESSRSATHADIATLSRTVGDMAAKISEMAADVAVVKSQLQMHAQQRGEEIRALFDRTGRHAEKIGAIEKDYTPRAVHDELVAKVETHGAVISQWRGSYGIILTVINVIGWGGIVALIKWGGA